MKEGRIVLALVLLTLVGCSNKTDVDKLNFLRKGNMAFDQGNFGEAIRFYNESIVRDSGFADAWNNRGIAEMQLKQYDEAIFSFRSALDNKPDYTSALLNSVKANLAVHQYFAALDQLDDLEKLMPDTSVVYFTRGLVYHEMHKDAEAMNNLKKAWRLDPSNSETLINIANIFYHLEDYDSALFYLKDALKIDTTQPNAYNILAMTYAGQGEYTKALTAINTAGSIDDKDPFIVNNKGYILLKMDKAKEAEAYFVKSMKLDPYNGWVYRNIGLLRYGEADYKEAIRMFEKARDYDNTIDSIDLDLAKAYLANGEVEKACNQLANTLVTDQVIKFLAENCK